MSKKGHMSFFNKQECDIIKLAMDWMKKTEVILSPDDRKFLDDLFRNCPETLLDSAYMIRVAAGKNIMKAQEPCDKVYILLEGIAQGVDEQTVGRIFPFFEFRPPEIIGDFEIFAEIPCYRASIYAVETCRLLVIHRKQYLEWMQKDVNALFIRTKILMKQMADQSQQNRRYYFLQGIDRLILYLVGSYEKIPDRTGCRIRKTRNEISSELGCSLKTLNRSIKKLHDDGLIQLVSGKIYVTADQYEKLRASIAEKKELG